MMGLFGANKVCPSSYIEEDPFKKERKKIPGALSIFREPVFKDDHYKKKNV
jgi:hypothetical protein